MGHASVFYEVCNEAMTATNQLFVHCIINTGAFDQICVFLSFVVCQFNVQWVGLRSWTVGRASAAPWFSLLTGWDTARDTSGDKPAEWFVCRHRDQTMSSSIGNYTPTCKVLHLNAAFTYYSTESRISSVPSSQIVLDGPDVRFPTFILKFAFCFSQILLYKNNHLHLSNLISVFEKTWIVLSMV